MTYRVNKLTNREITILATYCVDVNGRKNILKHNCRQLQMLISTTKTGEYNLSTLEKVKHGLLQKDGNGTEEYFNASNFDHNNKLYKLHL